MKSKYSTTILLFLALFLSGCSYQKQDSYAQTAEKLKTSPLGAIDPQLLYGDEETAIIYNHAGLLIFSYVEKQITYALDFEEEEIAVQGDDAWSIYVDANGQFIFFEKSFNQDGFLYDIQNSNRSALDESFYEKGAITEQYDILPQKDTVFLTSEKEISLNWNSDLHTLEGLEVVITTPAGTEHIPVFQ